MAQETPEDDIPDSENKMELYKFDFKAAARPPFDPNATFQDSQHFQSKSFPKLYY